MGTFTPADTVQPCNVGGRAFENRGDLARSTFAVAARILLRSVRLNFGMCAAYVARTIAARIGR